MYVHTPLHHSFSIWWLTLVLMECSNSVACYASWFQESRLEKYVQSFLLFQNRTQNSISFVGRKQKSFWMIEFAAVEMFEAELTRKYAESISPCQNFSIVQPCWCSWDEFWSLSHLLQILVRVRPFNDRESSLGEHSCLKLTSDQQLSLLPHSESSQYIFDHVLRDDTTQARVFEGELPYCPRVHTVNRNL